MLAKVQLPQPTGPNIIGVMDFELTDQAREEQFAPGTKRRIPVRVWYPAASATRTLHPYMKPEELKQIRAFAGQSLAPFVEGLVDMLDIPTHAYENAPVLRGARRPVLIFSHGASTFIQCHTALMEHLASHGYVVLSISHPYVSLVTFHEDGDVIPFSPSVTEEVLAGIAEVAGTSPPDDPGERLEEFLKDTPKGAWAPHFLVWEEDFLHVVDRLFDGRLPARAQPLSDVIDLDRLGVFGMSLGASGSAAAQHDTRIRATINLDGAVFDTALIDSESRVPVLVMHGDLSMVSPGRVMRSTTEFFYENLRTIGTRSDIIRVETKGATHIDYTDFCLTAESLRADASMSGAPAMASMFGTIDGRRMTEIVNDFCKAFFDYFLSGKGAGLDAAFRNRYPEVVDIDLSYVRAWAAANPQPDFLSFRHMQITNGLLATNTSCRRAAKALSRPYLLAFELSDAPKGKTARWQMHLDPKAGISINADEPTQSADLAFKGDWSAAMHSMLVANMGRDPGSPLVPISKNKVLATIEPALAAARSAAASVMIFPKA